MDYRHAFSLYGAFVKAADVITVVAVWFLCYYLRFSLAWLPLTRGLPNFSHYSSMALPLGVVFLIALHAVGAYRRDRIRFGFRSIRKMLQGSLFGTLLFVSICYFLREFDYSRYYLALFLFLLFPFLVLERFAIEKLWTIFQRRFVEPIRILLIGTGDLLESYLLRVNRRDPYPVTWVGTCGNAVAIGNSMIQSLGPEQRLPQIIDENRIDRIVVSYPAEQSSRYEEILRVLANEPVEVRVLPDFGRYNTFAYRADEECGIPLLTFNELPVGGSDRAFKRAFDIIGSLLFLTVFSPLYLGIALLVKLTSRGPIFYSQERVGADGHRFKIVKFRTMKLDAEALSGAVWAVEDDPRTTPLGRWLRRLSLDEIPQFYNVLRGDMSIVGPRPERPVFVEQFRKDIPKYMLRHKMKSGITGWAQVNGWRGNTSLDERIKYDLFYIGHWSHLLDFKIICMTLWKGFIHDHAY